VEAVRVMVEAVRAWGVGRIVAHIHPDHAVSRRVAEHAGLAPTAHIVDGETEWQWSPAVQASTTHD
jgi:RimJ/RimL family protein N-acetyltransferase